MVAVHNEPRTEPPAPACGIMVQAYRTSRGEWQYRWGAIAPNFRGDGSGTLALDAPATAEDAALAGVASALRAARHSPAIPHGTRFTVVVNSAAAVALLNDSSPPAPRFARAVAELRNEIAVLNAGSVQFHVQPGCEDPI